VLCRASRASSDGSRRSRGRSVWNPGVVSGPNAQETTTGGPRLGERRAAGRTSPGAGQAGAGGAWAQRAPWNTRMALDKIQTPVSARTPGLMRHERGRRGPSWPERSAGTNVCCVVREPPRRLGLDARRSIMPIRSHVGEQHHRECTEHMSDRRTCNRRKGAKTTEEFLEDL
jgi:hypothetical protein